ncbi:MAG: hypothetical protein ACYSWW_11130 [Planctomycetota bacterium]|jgi:hypothetical protein
MVYFEVDCPVAKIKNLPPRARYTPQWFDPRTGQWSAADDSTLRVDDNGVIQLPEFPGNEKLSDVDWALKMKRVEPCVVVKGQWDRHDIRSILLKCKHLPPWTSQSQFRPFAVVPLPLDKCRRSLVESTIRGTFA